MLHAAPTSETKADTAQSKTQVVPQPERELHPHVLSTAGRYSSSGMSGIASGASPDAQRRQALAGMQSMQGNQAVLRMLHTSPQVARMTALRPSQGIMLQRKCACGGSSETEGECAECKAKHEGTLQRRAANPTVSPAAAHGMPPVVHVHPPAAGVLQTKLAINQPGDEYEQEADRISDQVMTVPAHHAVSDALPRIQRFSGQSNGQMDTAPASVDQALASPGRPLEPALRQDMEQRFGHDFSRVRVHSGAAAEQSAGDVNAHAYTVGHDMVFGAGLFAPETQEGRRLIAHELTHVVQQSRADGNSVGRNDARRGLSPVSSVLSSKTALQREPSDPDETSKRQEGGEPEALFTVFIAEERYHKDKKFARKQGKADAARIRKSGKLSSEDGQLLKAKLRFFEGEAWEVYNQEIKPALVQVTREEIEMLEEGGPIIKDVLRLNQTLPIKGIAANQSNYVDRAFRTISATPLLAPDIILIPRTDPTGQNGISILKSDFHIDKDPLSGGFAVGHLKQVYQSRAVAEAVVADLDKLAPGTSNYAYYLRDGIIFPTILSDTTIPNLMPYIRQKREQDIEEAKALAELAEAVLLWYVGARFPIKVGRTPISSGPAASAGPRAAAMELAEQVAAKHGKVVVNLGGTGEVANAINVNPLTAQQVKDVPNLVRAGAEEVGSLFKPGTVDKIVSNDIVRGTVNWSKAAEGSFSVLKSGGQVSIAPYAGDLAVQLREIQAALEAAGFKDVAVGANRYVTAVKP